VVKKNESRKRLANFLQPLLGEQDLIRQLRGIGRRQWRWVLMAHVLRVVWGGCGVLLGLILLDAVWPMADVVRVVLGVLFVMAIAFRMVRAISAVPPVADVTNQAAVRIEKRFELKNNRLINALSLAQLAASGGGDLRGLLAQRCVKLAQSDTGSVDCDSVIDCDQLRREGLGLVAVLFVWFVMGLVQPNLITGGLARWSLPWGDHPRFSLTQFEVGVSPQPVKVGHNAVVTVQMFGWPGRDPRLVQLDKADQIVRSWSMLKTDSQAYQRRLIALTEPMRFWVATDTGRSHAFWIHPVHPAVPEDPGSVDQSEHPNRLMEDRNIDSTPGLTAQARRSVVLLGGLADRARRLESQAIELAQRLEQRQDLPGVLPMLGRLDQINQQIAQFQHHHGAAMQRIRTGSADFHQPLAAALKTVARHLEQLMLAHHEAYKSNDSPMAGAMPAQRGGTLNSWLRQLQGAAKKDRRVLDEARSTLDGLLLTGVATSGMPGSMMDVPSVVQTGHQHEQVRHDTIVADQPDAVVQQAPESYRQLVANYFQRLAQDQVIGSPRSRP